MRRMHPFSANHRNLCPPQSRPLCSWRAGGDCRTLGYRFPLLQRICLSPRPTATTSSASITYTVRKTDVGYTEDRFAHPSFVSLGSAAGNGDSPRDSLGGDYHDMRAARKAARNIARAWPSIPRRAFTVFSIRQVRCIVGNQVRPPGTRRPIFCCGFILRAPRYDDQAPWLPLRSGRTVTRGLGQKYGPPATSATRVCAPDRSFTVLARSWLVDAPLGAFQR